MLKFNANIFTDKISPVGMGSKHRDIPLKMDWNIHFINSDLFECKNKEIAYFKNYVISTSFVSLSLGGRIDSGALLTF